MVRWIPSSSKTPNFDNELSPTKSHVGRPGTARDGPRRPGKFGAVAFTKQQTIWSPGFQDSGPSPGPRTQDPGFTHTNVCAISKFVISLFSKKSEITSWKFRKGDFSFFEKVIPKKIRFHTYKCVCDF